jgi:deoxyribodipyrimidine photo-lyase
MPKGFQGQKIKMKAVWWIKRDFRVTDNTCLTNALDKYGEVVPFFCWERCIIKAGDFSDFHLQAQVQALEGLTNSIAKRGGYTRIVFGEIIEQLEKLFCIYPLTHLYSHQETGNLVSYMRDVEVRKWCEQHGVIWEESVQNSVLRGGDANRRRSVATHSNFRETRPLPSPDRIDCPSDKNLIEQKIGLRELRQHLPNFSGFSPSANLQAVNEKSAWSTLHSFLNSRGIGYSGGISSPNTAFENGSRLSVHLAWGTLSLRSIFAEIGSKRSDLKNVDRSSSWKRSLRAFESRLHWRDHFIQRLESFPNMETHTLNPAFESLEYENREEFLDAWVAGQTGFPMVDACMRCLGETGFMNFRMRAMIVSFACFGLHLSWRFIHEPLARLFLDYEPGIHLSQLQMQAGVIGFNTLRVYSPVKQFLDHDPDAKFVKRWLPELNGRTPAEIANSSEIKFPEYRTELIPLKDRAKEMKARVFSIRKSQEGWKATQRSLSKHGSKRTIRKPKNKKDSGQMQFPL